MIKCLLSYETSHYVVYLKAANGAGWLSFDEARAYLISHYSGLVERLKLDFGRDKFEIFDSDFEQYVIVDRCTRIGNLCKLKVTKQQQPVDRPAGLNTQLLALNSCFNSCMNSCLDGCLNSSKDTSRDADAIKETNQQSVNKEFSSKDNGLDRRKNSVGVVSRGTPIQPNRNVPLSASQESTPVNTTNRITLMNGLSVGESVVSSAGSSAGSTTNQHTSPRSASGNRSNCSNCSNCSSTFIGDSTVVFNAAAKSNDFKSNNFKPNDAKPNDVSSKSRQSDASSNHRTVQCQTLDTERRIIHLRENPFLQRCLKLRADYGRLIEENKRLAAKLELYKQGSVANATNYLDDFVSNADTIERLQKELAEAKDEQKTIMEAFKKKSKEFRRVVYLLTGFKFDALEQRKYRVSHVYANPSDYLFFTFEKEEVINLLGNEFSEQFIDLIKTYLVQHGSYPSFLASITIKLFKEFKERSLESTKKPIV